MGQDDPTHIPFDLNQLKAPKFDEKLQKTLITISNK